MKACFTVVRSTELPRAKPVREAVVDVRPNNRVAGLVLADGDIPIPKARIRITGSDRLIIADHNGHFDFAAPAGLSVKAVVSAKGRETHVELTPGQPNIVTLSMEA